MVGANSEGAEHRILPVTALPTLVSQSFHGGERGQPTSVSVHERKSNYGDGLRNSRSLGWENLQRRKWHPTLVFLPGKFHGQKSLVGCKKLA